MKYQLPPTPSEPFQLADLPPPPRGHRFEIVDGSLRIGPGAGGRHQQVRNRILTALRASCPANLTVVADPVDLVLAPDRVFSPDLVVLPAGAATAPVRDRPTLVVEVCPPETPMFAHLVKLPAYAEAGIPAYWVVDLDRRTVTVYERGPGPAYVEAGLVEGSPLDVNLPFPVTVTNWTVEN